MVDPPCMGQTLISTILYACEAEGMCAHVYQYSPKTTSDCSVQGAVINVHTLSVLMSLQVLMFPLVCL